jgi:hypothetical protein
MPAAALHEPDHPVDDLGPAAGAVLHPVGRPRSDHSVHELRLEVVGSEEQERRHAEDHVRVRQADPGRVRQKELLHAAAHVIGRLPGPPQVLERVQDHDQADLPPGALPERLQNVQVVLPHLLRQLREPRRELLPDQPAEAGVAPERELHVGDARVHGDLLRHLRHEPADLLPEALLGPLLLAQELLARQLLADRAGKQDQEVAECMSTYSSRSTRMTW